jgi:hypothetical protein
MIQKSRLRLFVVGAALAASIAIAPFVPYFWAPAAILMLTGAYLVVWATVGKGSWCRNCKKFGVQ